MKSSPVMIKYVPKKGSDRLHWFTLFGISIGLNETLLIAGSIFLLCVAHWCVFFSVVMLASSVGISKEDPDFVRIQHAFSSMEKSEEKEKTRHNQGSKKDKSRMEESDDNDNDEDDELGNRYSFRSGAVYLARSKETLRPKIKGGVLGLLVSAAYAFYSYKTVELPVLILLTTLIILSGIRSAFKFGESWDERLEEHAEEQEEREEQKIQTKQTDEREQRHG